MRPANPVLILSLGMRPANPVLILSLGMRPANPVLILSLGMRPANPVLILSLGMRPANPVLILSLGMRPANPVLILSLGMRLHKLQVWELDWSITCCSFCTNARETEIPLNEMMGYFGKRSGMETASSQCKREEKECQESGLGDDWEDNTSVVPSRLAHKPISLKSLR